MQPMLTTYEHVLVKVLERTRETQRTLVSRMILAGKFGHKQIMNDVLCDLNDINNLLVWLELEGHEHTLNERYAACVEGPPMPGVLPAITDHTVALTVVCEEENLYDIRVLDVNNYFQPRSLSITGYPAEGTLLVTLSGKVIYQHGIAGVYTAQVSVRDIWNRTHTVNFTYTVPNCEPCPTGGNIVPIEGISGNIIQL